MIRRACRRAAERRTARPCRRALSVERVQPSSFRRVGLVISMPQATGFPCASGTSISIHACGLDQLNVLITPARRTSLVVSNMAPLWWASAGTAAKEQTASTAASNRIFSRAFFPIGVSSYWPAEFSCWAGGLRSGPTDPCGRGRRRGSTVLEKAAPLAVAHRSGVKRDLVARLEGRSASSPAG